MVCFVAPPLLPKPPPMYSEITRTLLAGIFTTADCLSEEKREGTLGLLFLTDLKGYDIVLGKIVAASVNWFFGLLALFPVLALSLLMGGVAPGEFWRKILGLATSLTERAK